MLASPRDKLVKSVKIKLSSPENGHKHSLQDIGNHEFVDEFKGLPSTPILHVTDQKKDLSRDQSLPRSRSKPASVSTTNRSHASNRELFEKIQQALEVMTKQGNVMFILPYSFDVKDSDGNVLLSVDGDDYYSDDDMYSEDEEDEEGEELDFNIDRNGRPQKPQDLD